MYVRNVGSLVRHHLGTRGEAGEGEAKELSVGRAGYARLDADLRQQRSRSLAR
jgi:hypothetical protein